MTSSYVLATMFRNEPEWLYAEAGTAAGTTSSRRHQGPARRRTRPPTINVAPSPVGMPQKGEAEQQRQRAPERRQLMAAKAAGKAQTNQKSDRDRQHHHVVHEEI